MEPRIFNITMKSTRLFATALLLGVCVIAWVMFLDSLTADEAAQAEHLEAAESYYEGRLYELAIEEYSKAVSIAPSEDIYRTMIDACDAFYAEEGTAEARKLLLSALTGVNQDYPELTEYWEKHAALYIEMGKFSDAVSVLSTAQKKGAESETLTAQYLEAYYAVKLHYQTYLSISDIASEGYYVIGEDTMMGVIDTAAADLIIPVYAYVGPVGEDGSVLVRTEEGESFIMDEDGVKIGRISGVVAQARAYSEEKIAVRFEGREDWCFVDCAGNELFGGFLDAGRFVGGTAAVKNADGTWTLINENGNSILDGTFEEILLDADGSFEIRNRAVMKKNGVWGMYSDDGESLNEFTADAMDLSRGEGIAFMKDGKWGFVDRSGNVVIEPQYDGARSFSCGVAAVMKDGKWGFINKENQLVIAYDYEYAGYFEENGSCPVKAVDADGYSLIYWKVNH